MPLRYNTMHAFHTLKNHFHFEDENRVEKKEEQNTLLPGLIPIKNSFHCSVSHLIPNIIEQTSSYNITWVQLLCMHKITQHDTGQYWLGLSFFWGDDLISSSVAFCYAHTHAIPSFHRISHHFILLFFFRLSFCWCGSRCSSKTNTDALRLRIIWEH